MQQLQELISNKKSFIMKNKIVTALTGLELKHPGNLIMHSAPACSGQITRSIKTGILISVMILGILNVNAQSVGIGTATPNPSAQLDISSNAKGLLIPRMTEAEKNAVNAPSQGLMLFNTTTNSFQFYNGSSWINISHSGIISGTANKVAKFNGPWGLTPGMITDNGAGVSINTTAAVAGNSALLDISSNSKGILIPRMTSAERLVIVSPATGLMVFDNSTVSFWFYNGTAWEEFNTGSTGSGWTASGNNILSTNIGSVGIHVINPVATLDVNGTIHSSDGAFFDSYLQTVGSAYIGGTGNITGPANIGGNIHVSGPTNSIAGSLTINNGKGVAYNPASATNLKVYPFTTGTFTAILPGFGLSAEGAIGFGGGFTNPPKVLVGDIYSTGGTLGELYRVQLILYDCTNNSCKARLLNTSPNAVNYSIRWNCVAVGD
jgi:hypothetical protein